ncbi:MAG: aminotransferase class I/II-fold pyridoxal phosphate-dependent enzyme [Clostridiales Family XIII bacterium]|jgi:cystathionine beta-lyase/cystathionine gamma-synthase|nr:aminotransferase class I/II-fold pyridoxal phosphate-dependent enzyme [Clostridiales Family XIII bacterium]
MGNNIDTLCVHGAEDRNNSTGAVTVPVYQSATFAHPGVGQSTGYDYSRLQNPTREVLEKTIAMLEGGCDAMAFSSGMAAMAVLCELFAPGDRVIASEDLYGGSVRLLDNVVGKNGVGVDYLDTGSIEDVRSAIRPETKAVFVETPTNPTMRITDIAAISAICKECGLLLIVDSTFLTPVYLRPLALGADIVLHSGTKYLGGHNDTLAGFLITASAGLSEKLRFLYKTVGACLAPWDCFLILRGVKTLALRMGRITENARRISAWLEKQPQVADVMYCGQSGMISFKTDNAETAHTILANVKVIRYAESLGGVESLITYPILQTHADVPAAVREALGIDERLLRLSAGIEHADDLIADLEAALNGI